MKKYYLAIALILIMMVGLIGCAQSTTVEKTRTEQTKEEGTVESYQVAMVMDIGILNDRSFNQGAWEGLQEFCDTNGLTYKYFKAEEDSTASFQKVIEDAIGDETKAVVCPGYLFETPVYNVQDKYPDVKFILIDGEPHNEDYSDYRTAPNTLSVLYREDQAGFLAGYAAVKDGNTNLGFMGGVALPAVLRYGYGYLAGAELAAEEEGENVSVNYTYTGSFEASDKTQEMAAQWYSDNTEVIFSCGGLVGNSVMLAAEQAGSMDESENAEGTGMGKVIGVDVDQNAESITVMTSAMKMIANSVKETLESIQNGTFEGGRAINMDVNNDGVGIAMETSRFASFSQEDYDNILDRLISGEVSVDVDIARPIKDMKLEHVVVNEIE